MQRDHPRWLHIVCCSLLLPAVTSTRNQDPPTKALPTRVIRDILVFMDAPLPHTGQVRPPEDDKEWRQRSLHWLQISASRRPKDKRIRRQPRRDPLILAGHGVSLRVEAGTLLVRNGFTHYPQKQETYRFFKADADLPPRIIMLDGSGSITFDVLTWLNQQKVALVKVDWTGNAVTVASGESFAANRDRVAWQAETRSDRRKRMEFCNALIARKIEGCIQTLEESLRRSHAWDRAMKRAKDDLARLANDPPETVNELRLLEARSAVAYFRAWYSTSLLWRASARHPIPDEWRTVGPRFTRVYAAGSRNASHPVNAILNYAYAVLQSQVQIRLVAEGYDPMLGIMHSDRDDAPAFVFDMMEPERPKVDRAMLGFLKSVALHPADFTIREDGVVRLNPELARWVARMAV
jgi:CRISP-associated protein Cas1